MIDATMNGTINGAMTACAAAQQGSDEAIATAGRIDYPPRLTFYHPNGKGQGSAVAFELEPATSEKDGSIYLQIAAQNGTGAPAANGQPKRHASFDWRNRITAKLNFAEVAEIMLVLCGMAPSNSKNGRNGFFHDTASATTTIDLKRGEDPARPGFILGVAKTPKTNPDARQYTTFVFSLGEALGLRLALEHAMGLLAFGVPRIRARNAVAPSPAQQPEMDAPAF